MKKILPNNIKIHSHLVHYRIIARFPPTALAERVGISQSNLYKIETGKVIPSIATALRLAKALSVSVDELFTLEEISSQTLENRQNEYFGRLLNRHYKFKTRCLIRNYKKLT